jgi:hypothetical protein
MQNEDTDTQDAWDIATKAISRGKLVSVAGPVLSYVVAIGALFGVVDYLANVDGDLRVVGASMSLATAFASLVAGQIVGLYGLRSMMHGFQTQNWILNQDTDE